VLLQAAITEWSKVYIIADAIDEYPEDQRQMLLKDLASLSPTVNLLVTSRPHITLTRSFATFEVIDIRTNPDDIRRYVDAHIETSSCLSKHTETRPEIREEIHLKISSSVDGM
jgi:hypothetical protein